MREFLRWLKVWVLLMAALVFAAALLWGWGMLMGWVVTTIPGWALFAFAFFSVTATGAWAYVAPIPEGDEDHDGP